VGAAAAAARGGAVARRTPGLYINALWFQGGFVFKARRLVYHSTLGLRVIKKKKLRVAVAARGSAFARAAPAPKHQGPHGALRGFRSLIDYMTRFAPHKVLKSIA